MKYIKSFWKPNFASTSPKEHYIFNLQHRLSKYLCKNFPIALLTYPHMLGLQGHFRHFRVSFSLDVRFNSLKISCIGYNLYYSSSSPLELEQGSETMTMKKGAHDLSHKLWDCIPFPFFNIDRCHRLTGCKFWLQTLFTIKTYELKAS